MSKNCFQSEIHRSILFIVVKTNQYTKEKVLVSNTCFIIFICLIKSFQLCFNRLLFDIIIKEGENN